MLGTVQKCGTYILNEKVCNSNLVLLNFPSNAKHQNLLRALAIHYHIYIVGKYVKKKNIVNALHATQKEYLFFP